MRLRGQAQGLWCRVPQLSQYEDAILDIEKLEHYCLNASHPRGRHKARVFWRVLRVGVDDAKWLRSAIVAGLRTGEAEQLESDDYGARYRVDVPVVRQDRRAVIRTVWMVRSGETAPRFVTCWLL